MVDEDKKVDNEDNESELDLSFKGKAKASKINILGYETDVFGLGALLLGAIATAGTGYLLYDHINKNKAIEEQKKYESWIAQQQALHNQQMVQPPIIQTQPQAPVQNDMIDTNSVPTVNYDRFLDRGGPITQNTPRYQVDAQPLKLDPNAEAVIDMDKYSGIPPESTEPNIPPPSIIEKKRDPTTAEELMAAMNTNNYDYGSS